ncbi:hypothetical protein BCU68_07865 [Vibrio sp. 10N.286.49.B3]|nr:hypothetical protein BCU68_07865 [Vibrio sp. 10N.286.49.B3]
MKVVQTGMATLVMTTILLSAALMMSLGTYRAMFLQIKLAQNEVKVMQDKWLASGGLECAYAQFKRLGQQPEVLVECLSDPLLQVTVTIAGNAYQISSTHDQYSMKQTLVIDSNTSVLLAVPERIYWQRGTWHDH